MSFTNEEFEMCIEGLNSEDPDIRRESAEDLGYSEREEAPEILLKYLMDLDRGVRDAVAESLKRVSNKDTAFKIVEFLRSDEIVLRNFAVDILEYLDKESIPALKANMFDHDHDVRKFIVDILGLVKDTSCLPQMYELLNDKDLNVQISVVEALGNIGSKDSIEPLKNISKSNPTFKATAIESLGKIGDESVVEFILEACNDEDPLISFTAIETLGNIGKKEQIKILMEMILSKEDFHISSLFMAILKISEKLEISFFDSLCQFGKIDKKYINIALAEEDVVKSLSANILEYGNCQLLEHIKDYLEFLSKDAKLRIIEILREGYQEKHQHIVADLLNDHDQWVVFKMCNFVADLKIKQVKPEILSLLNRDNPMLQIAGIKVFNDLHEKDVLGTIENLMKESSNEDVVKEATIFIENLKKGF